MSCHIIRLNAIHDINNNNPALVLTHASGRGYVFALQIDNQILGFKVPQFVPGQGTSTEYDAPGAQRPFAGLVEAVQTE